MPLSIKSETADQLARVLAAETGESLTEAVVVALRERSRPEPRRDHRRLRRRRAPRVTESTAQALVVDTSAVVAVMTAEPGSDELVGWLEGASRRLMSAATRVELGIVVESRLGTPGRDALDRFLRDTDIEIVEVEGAAAEHAVAAWRRFGKGRHRAAQNYVGCFVYALADRTGLPVLCTGEDFAATDLHVVGPTPNSVSQHT